MRYVAELPRAVSHQQEWFAVTKRRIGQFDIVHHVSLGDKDVEPAVIVIVDHLRSPTGVPHGDPADAAGVAHIVKAPFAVSEQRIASICKGIDKGVRPTVVVIVSEVDSHAREGFAILIESETGFERHIGECAVAVISKELLRERVVGDKDVRPPVAVEVAYCNAQRLSVNVPSLLL